MLSTHITAWHKLYVYVHLWHVRGVFETAEDGGKDLDQVQGRLVHWEFYVSDTESNAALSVDIVDHLTAERVSGEENRLRDRAEKASCYIYTHTYNIHRSVLESICTYLILKRILFQNAAYCYEIRKICRHPLSDELVHMSNYSSLPFRWRTWRWQEGSQQQTFSISCCRGDRETRWPRRARRDRWTSSDTPRQRRADRGGWAWTSGVAAASFSGPAGSLGQRLCQFHFRRHQSALPQSWETTDYHLCRHNINEDPTILAPLKYYLHATYMCSI